MKKLIESDFQFTTDVILYECEDNSLPNMITFVERAQDQSHKTKTLTLTEEVFGNLVQKMGYVKAKPAADNSKKLDEFESYIYKGEDGYLYMLEEKTGRIWNLKGGDYAGEHGTPLPGYIKGIGEMTLLGVFSLGD